MTRDGLITRILLASRHTLFREGVRDLLEAEEDFEVVGEASDEFKVLHCAQMIKPDILLLDSDLLELPGSNLSSALTVFRGVTRFVMLTDDFHPTRIAGILQSGFDGVINRDSSAGKLFECLRTVSRGSVWVGGEIVDSRGSALKSLERTRISKVPPEFGLTKREVEIIALVVSGRTNKEISHFLIISEDTVKHHLSNIFDKVGVYNRLELALFTVHHGLLGKSVLIATSEKGRDAIDENSSLVG